MITYTEDQIGIELLSEISFGWFLIEKLSSSGYYIAYRDDGTTPLNVINNFSWLDDRREIVRRSDFTATDPLLSPAYTEYQIPLPIVSYDFVTSTAFPIELGGGHKSLSVSPTLLIHAENKAQLINLSGFVKAVLETYQIPVLDYNSVGNPQIGVIYCEDVISNRFYSSFLEGDLSAKHTITITCSATVEYDQEYLN
jgi:hypothetical protein